MDIRSVSDQELFAEYARRLKCADKPSGKVIFLGPPGGGKGTQAPRLADEYCWCQVSTGDMLREAVAKGTDLGKKAKSIMEKGDLVPDDLVIGLIQEKVKKPECQRGVILDGFPRTEEQAKALDNLLTSEGSQIDRVVEFQIGDELLTERVVGRRIHKSSGRTYHVKFNPPKTEGVDDVTGEPLIQRSDDTEAVIKNRLDQYHKMTAPLINYYSNQGKLFGLNADRPINDIYEDLKSKL